MAHTTFLIASMSCLIACGKSGRVEYPKGDHKVSEPFLLAATDAHIVYEGRWQKATLGPQYVMQAAWPASSVEVNFEGTWLSADFNDEPYLGESPGNRLIVELDGHLHQIIQLDPGSHRYRLFSGLESKPRNIKIIKRTESNVGTVSLQRFVWGMHSKFLNPDPIQRPYMVVIGDSISAGFGILNDKCEEGAAAHEDASSAYGAIAARSLSMRYVATAWSGKGVYRNENPDDTVMLADLMSRRLPEVAESEMDHCENAAVVVVHLGTNDMARPNPDARAFVQSYHTMLNDIRGNYPSADIIVAQGPMVSDDYPPHSMALKKIRTWLTQIVRGRRRAGDHHLHYLEFPLAASTEGYGCFIHPSGVTHKRMAKALIAKIETIRKKPKNARHL